MDDKEQLVDERIMEQAAVVPANPEERAFNGHPDHPPATPDQTVEGNHELLQGSEEKGKPE